MANTTKPLTNTEIKQAKAKEKQYNLSDGRGLALRINPNGAKYWIFNYLRPFSKKRANISFGSYPELSLANARKLRDSARELLAQDIDPKEHRDEQSLKQKHAHAHTLEYVTNEWIKIKKSQVSSDHADKILRSLSLHVFPSLGNIPLHKLTAPKVIDTLKPIETKGSLETVKRLCQRMNEVMVWAVNTGLITTNPLAGIGKAFLTPPVKHFPTIQPNQLPELMKKLSVASIKITTRCLIEWQLHTMLRPDEAAGTRWDEIDIEKSLWHIPFNRMKKKKAHTVPLSPQALAILEVMRPISGNRTHVFPGDRKPTKPTHAETANTALRRMGYTGILVAHGLRSLASTTLNEQAFDGDIVESALAHIDKNGVRGAYNHAEYLERRRVMMCEWSNHIERAATGSLSVAAASNIFNLHSEHNQTIISSVTA